MRDLDAHSWVEVCTPGYGWVTFDPTPGRRAGALAGRRRPGRRRRRRRRRARRTSAATCRGRPAAAAAPRRGRRRAVDADRRSAASSALADRRPRAVGVARRRRRRLAAGSAAAVAELERALRAHAPRARARGDAQRARGDAPARRHVRAARARYVPARLRRSARYGHGRRGHRTPAPAGARARCRRPELGARAGRALAAALRCARSWALPADGHGGRAAACPAGLHLGGRWTTSTTSSSAGRGCSRRATSTPPPCRCARPRPRAGQDLDPRGARARAVPLAALRGGARRVRGGRRARADQRLRAVLPRPVAAAARPPRRRRASRSRWPPTCGRSGATTGSTATARGEGSHGVGLTVLIVKHTAFARPPGRRSSESGRSPAFLLKEWRCT